MNSSKQKIFYEILLIYYDQKFSQDYSKKKKYVKKFRQKNYQKNFSGVTKGRTNVARAPPWKKNLPKLELRFDMEVICICIKNLKESRH